MAYFKIFSGTVHDYVVKLQGKVYRPLFCYSKKAEQLNNFNPFDSCKKSSRDW